MATLNISAAIIASCFAGLIFTLKQFSGKNQRNQKKAGKGIILILIGITLCFSAIIFTDVQLIMIFSGIIVTTLGLLNLYETLCS
jgi:hypothetical protein